MYDHDIIYFIIDGYHVYYRAKHDILIIIVLIVN
jgi:hypothetical protein